MGRAHSLPVTVKVPDHLRLESDARISEEVGVLIGKAAESAAHLLTGPEAFRWRLGTRRRDPVCRGVIQLCPVGHLVQDIPLLDAGILDDQLTGLGHSSSAATSGNLVTVDDLSRLLCHRGLLGWLG